MAAIHPSARWRACYAGMHATCLQVLTLAAAVLSPAPTLHAQAIDPLALTPEPVSSGAAHAPWGLRLELWQQSLERRSAAHQAQGAGATVPASQQRAVLDFRREWALGTRTRLGLSQRAERVRATTGSQTRYALREAYLSHALATGWFVDAGRINWRGGVASGFNPTDFLREGASIDQGTQDPRALRENRLGTVMLRSQWVHPAGALQLALIPSLQGLGNQGPRSFAWSRTNASEAVLLKLSPRLSERTSLDALAYWRSGDAPRHGVNVTHLLGDALVLYTEAAPSSRTPSSAGAATSTQRRGMDWALGGTWSTRQGPVLTTELQRDARQDSRMAFVRLAWDQPLHIANTQLSAFVRGDLQHDQRWWQWEWTWHLRDRHSLSLLLGGQDGASGRLRCAGDARRYGAVAWRIDF